MADAKGPFVAVDWDRVWNLTLWVLQAFLAAVFLLFGASKFSEHVAFWVQLFARIGIGQWFRYFTGGLEVICGVLLLIPKTSAIAAGLLACTMVGAIFVHLFILHDGSAWVFSGFPLLILVAIAWKRRPDFPVRL
ncbi:MAG TPA: DoxX family protein [Terriglobia bacterium]|nr:DoxX family protein [Terriglobia bacterium]